MAITTANLLSGTPQLYLAATGEALPEVNDLTPPAVTVTVGGTWSAVGATVEDYIFSYEPTFEPVMVNEHLNVIDLVLAQEEVKFTVSFAEFDARAIADAIAATSVTAVAAGADQTAQDQIKIGDGTATKTAILIVGTSPEAGSRVIHFPFAYATGTVEMPFSKSKKTSFGAEFTILSDPAATAGQTIGTIYDITAVAST